jgi:hypothetical protein
MGTSVPPTASSKAITGLPATRTTQRHGCTAPPRRSASQNTTTKTMPNQILGSVRIPRSNSARGSPNSAMTGRYGL